MVAHRRPADAHPIIMWRQWLVAATRAVTAIMLGGVYLTGYFVVQSGIEVVGMTVCVSLLAAALVSVVLGRARYMYLALLFMCAGPTLYSLTFVGVPLDSIAVAIVPLIGVITIAYGAAALREEGGEPYRDPVALLFGEDDELYEDDPLCIPTATVISAEITASRS